MAKKVTAEIDIKTNAGKVMKDIADLQKSFKALGKTNILDEKNIKTIGNQIKNYLNNANKLEKQYKSINQAINAIKMTGTGETKIGQKRLELLKAQAKELKAQIEANKELLKTDEEREAEAKEKEKEQKAKEAETHSKTAGAIQDLFKNRKSVFGNLSDLNEHRYQINKDKFGASAANKQYAKGQIAIMVVQAIFDKVKKIAGKFNDMLKTTMGIDLSFKSMLNDVMNRVGSELSKQGGMATYSMGTSLFTNAAAREQQMRYGISASQNYALTRTMGMLNMSNEEDLMYMNVQQRAMFQELMNKYQNWYEQMNQNGVLREVQQFQLEFDMFKQKIAMEFLTWFAKNKDAIFTFIKTTANVMMQLMQAVSALVNFFGAGKSANSADAVGVGVMSDRLSYSAASGGKTVNINVTQSNNVSGVDTNEWNEVFESNNEKAMKEVALAIGDIS